MLSCKELSQLASEHIDGKLSFYMKIKFNMHIFMCHHCRNFVNQLRIFINIMHHLKPDSPKDIIIDKQVKDLINISKNMNHDGSGNDRPK